MKQFRTRPAPIFASLSLRRGELDEMRVKQGPYPRVMHTPCHGTGALSQTHLLSQAGSQGKLESFLLKGITFFAEIFDVRFSNGFPGVWTADRADGTYSTVERRIWRIAMRPRSRYAIQRGSASSRAL